MSKIRGKVEDFEGPDRSWQLRKLAESQERVAALRQKLQDLGDSGNMEAPWHSKHINYEKCQKQYAAYPNTH